MKVAAATLSIARYADALELSEAPATAARLRAFIKALEPARAFTIDSLAQTCSGLRFPASGESPRLKELASPLEGLLQLFEDFAKPEILTGLKHLLAVVREHGDTPLLDSHLLFVSMWRLRPKGNPRRARANWQSLVDDYLKKLEAALGDDVAFRALFREIDADKRVTKLEAIELATRFMSPTPPSTSRPKLCSESFTAIKSLWTSSGLLKSIRRGRSAA